MIKIFGAGMAGLLTAHILKNRSPVIHELQPSLPDNHAALLRFRTNAVAEATGIAFKKVAVQKGLWDGKRLRTTGTLQHNNQYSLKVSGRATGRSILNLAPAERYIAPPDFLKRLAQGVNIVYGTGLEEFAVHGDGSVPLISTIPMPALANILGVEPQVKFEAKKIWTKTITIESPDIDLYQTVYFPESDIALYRASITGSRLTLEYVSDPEGVDKGGWRIHPLLEQVFGIEGAQVKVEGVKAQKFGKLLSVDDEVRRSFILYATEKFGIYSVGRFATWRQILLDDVVQDVQLVDKMIGQKDRYGMIKEIVKKG